MAKPINVIPVLRRQIWLIKPVSLTDQRSSFSSGNMQRSLFYGYRLLTVSSVIPYYLMSLESSSEQVLFGVPFSHPTAYNRLLPANNSIPLMVFAYYKTIDD